MDGCLSPSSDAPALFLVTDVVWSGNSLSLGLRDLWDLSPSPAVVGCDGEDTEERDGGRCVSELREACSSDPQLDRTGDGVSSPALTPSRILCELQTKPKHKIVLSNQRSYTHYNNVSLHVR